MYEANGEKYFIVDGHIQHNWDRAPRTPGAEHMTEFASSRTSSDRIGVTLMDSQVGHLVAEVM